MSLVAAGDVIIGGINDPFAKTKSIIKKADIAFCSLEGPYFDGRARNDIITWTPTWSPGPSSPGGPRSGVKGLEYVVDAGFDVVQVGNNHSLDCGEDAFLKTLQNLEEYNIKYSGAGRNLAEARRPVFFEAAGIKFVFLSYASIYKWGSEAYAKQAWHSYH